MSLCWYTGRKMPVRKTSMSDGKVAITVFSFSVHKMPLPLPLLLPSRLITAFIAFSAGCERRPLRNGKTRNRRHAALATGFPGSPKKAVLRLLLPWDKDLGAAPSRSTAGAGSRYEGTVAKRAGCPGRIASLWNSISEPAIFLSIPSLTKSNLPAETAPVLMIRS